MTVFIAERGSEISHCLIFFPSLLLVFLIFVISLDISLGAIVADLQCR